MSAKIKELLKLFITAFFQVAFVAMNITFISKEKLLLMFLTGFGISYMWTMNVKRVAFGSRKERFVYATGAAAGTLFGYFISKNLAEYL